MIDHVHTLTIASCSCVVLCKKSSDLHHTCIILYELRVAIRYVAT